MLYHNVRVAAHSLRFIDSAAIAAASLGAWILGVEVGAWPASTVDAVAVFVAATVAFGSPVVAVGVVAVGVVAVGVATVAVGPVVMLPRPRPPLSAKNASTAAAAQPIVRTTNFPRFGLAPGKSEALETGAGIEMRREGGRLSALRELSGIGDALTT